MVDELDDRLKDVQIIEPTMTREERINNLDIKPMQIEDPAYYRTVAHLHAFGADRGQISVMTGLPLDEVGMILGLPRVKDLAFDLQKKHANRDFQNLFMSLVPDAVDTARNLMMDRSVKDSTRLSASLAIMDRALGKPNQNIEVGGSMIRELFEKLDQHEAKRVDRAIEVQAKQVHNAIEDGEIKETTSPADTTEPPGEVDAVDTWIKDHLK